MKRRLSLVGLIVVVVIAGLQACDSANPVAPTGTLLTVTANPLQVAVNGESIITVTGFRPNGSPLFPGTQILLSADRGSLQPLTGTVAGGNLRHRCSTTQGRRECVSSRTAERGEATINATVTGGEDSGSATVTVQVGLAEDSKPILLMSANPSEIAVQQTSEISLLRPQQRRHSGRLRSAHSADCEPRHPAGARHLRGLDDRRPDRQQRRSFGDLRRR